MTEDDESPEEVKAGKHPDSRLLDNPNRNAEADKRLAVLTEVITKYQREHDFVEGGTVFGSTTGEASAKSDIDAVIFVDPDKVTAAEGVELDATDYRAMADIVERELFDGLGIRPGESSSGRRNDVLVAPINDRITTDLLADYEQQTARYQEFLETVDKATDEFFSTHAAGDDSSEAVDAFVLQTTGLDRHNQPSPILDRQLLTLFHPAVGDTSRIDTLRAKAIQFMQASPHGQQMWDDVVMHVAGFENNVHQEEIKFPQTLAEAQSAFSR